MVPDNLFIEKEMQLKEVLITFPPQHQDVQPGMEFQMNPRPVSEAADYTGSGKLKDKVAVITGGDSGIGRAVVYAFAKEGADVVVSYLNEQQDAEETKKRVEELGRRCELVAGDLRQESKAKEIAARAMDCYKKIDILVNNCAVQYLQKSILDITSQQLENTFQTNVFSFFYMTQAVLPHMQSGAAIINTTSVTAYEGNEQLIDYSATKGAIVVFTRSLALSLAGQGIRVNGVAPGPIWTPLIPASFPAEQVRTFGGGESPVPLRRAGQPCEVAPCYVFLASNDASYMTGQILHPDGGKSTGS